MSPSVPRAESLTELNLTELNSVIKSVKCDFSSFSSFSSFTATIPDIPDFAIDMHTARGRAMGKNSNDFVNVGSIVIPEDTRYLVESWKTEYNTSKQNHACSGKQGKKRKEIEQVGDKGCGPCKQSDQSDQSDQSKESKEYKVGKEDAINNLSISIASSIPSFPTGTSSTTNSNTIPFNCVKKQKIGNTEYRQNSNKLNL